MAWQVAIVLDERHTALIRQMPVWALETPGRREQMGEIQRSVNGLWGSEPGFTLFQAGGVVGSLEILNNIVGTVLEHHPRATCIDLIGIPASPELTQMMLNLDFETFEGSEDGLVFSMPISKIPDVPELDMDARDWQTMDDVFSSFFRAVGAPEWHGRNFDALIDSIEIGGINRIEVPYVLAITNIGGVGSHAVVGAQKFISLIREIEARGCPISVVIR